MLKDDPEIQQLLLDSYASTKLTAQVFFPELFYSPFSILHDQIFAWLDRKEYTITNPKSPNYGKTFPSNKKVCAAPRGIGKTTIVGTKIAKDIIWRDSPFVTYVTNSGDNAAIQTENIKSNLRTARVKELYGDIKIADFEGADETFGKKSWVAYGSTIVVPRGAGQQIRGLNWRGNRPQLLVIDDLEDKDEIQNEANRKKLKEWFFSDLEKCINRFLKNYTFIYIDTLKHEDSLLALLLESDDWDAINLSICDENYKSLDPNYMTDEEIAREVESHREKGGLDEFYREYMNIPISTEDAVFKGKFFRYYEEVAKDDPRCNQLIGNVPFIPPFVTNPNIETVIIVDPAKTVKLHSAESAIIGISFDRSMNRIIIRDLDAKKFYPDELYEHTFEMAKRLKAKLLAIEVTSLHEFIVQPVKNEIAKRNLNIEFMELNARGKKEDRIAMMCSSYRKGEVYHNKAISGPLEAQLLSFPRSKRWDCMDAEAYFIEVLEKGEKYFYTDTDEEPYDDESMPEDLEPAFANWRVC
jgi:phage terminase large subunit-like protein